MPVGIVLVVNNTTRALNYHNRESSLQFKVQGRTPQQEARGVLPISKYHDDRVPYPSSNHIDITFDSGNLVQISDKDGKFSVKGPVAFTGETKAVSYGSIYNAHKYILRVDEAGGKNCSFTFLKYSDEDSIKAASTSGEIDSQSIQQAVSVTGPILMSVFV